MKMVSISMTVKALSDLILLLISLTERKLIELAEEANDVVTADMLTGYLKEQEKMVWMLVAFSTRGCEQK